MDDTEARVRCVEAAAGICRMTQNYDVKSVVEIATFLYSFVNAHPTPETGPENTDKPRQRGKAKADPFS